MYKKKIIRRELNQAERQSEGPETNEAERAVRPQWEWDQIGKEEMSKSVLVRFALHNI